MTRVYFFIMWLVHLLILSLADNPYITIGYYTVNPVCDIYYIVSNIVKHCNSELGNDAVLFGGCGMVVVTFYFTHYTDSFTRQCSNAHSCNVTPRGA